VEKPAGWFNEDRLLELEGAMLRLLTSTGQSRYKQTLKKGLTR
jgi:hypothetical protein